MNISDLVNLGLTEGDLLYIREKALEMIKQGMGRIPKNISVPGLSTEHQIYATPLDLARAVSYALHQLDPEKYPVITVSGTRTIARSR